MNSFGRYHPFLSEERREALVSFPNATTLEFTYGFLCYDFEKITIIKVRHDAKLTGSALPDIQDRIKYFGDEEKNTENQRKEDIDTNKEKVKDQKENKKTNIYMKHIHYFKLFKIY